MSMQDKKLVGDVHDISLTLFRDVFAVPAKEWTNDNCFSLTFDSPYIESDFWAPFDPANPPECSVSTFSTIFEFKRINSKFNTDANLLFSFKSS